MSEINLEEYGSWGAADIKAAEDNAKKARVAGAGGSTYFKFPEGRTVIRMLPAKRPNPSIQTVWEHNLWPNSVPGLQDKINVACKRAHGHQDCPICNFAEQVRAEEGTDSKLYRAVKAKEKHYVNVMLPDDPDAGVFTLGLPWGIYKVIKQAVQDPGNMFGDIFHPLTGRDIIVTRKGTGANDTSYEAMISPQQTQLLSLEFLKDQPDLTLLENKQPREKFLEFQQYTRSVAALDVSPGFGPRNVTGTGTPHALPSATSSQGRY